MGQDKHMPATQVWDFSPRCIPEVGLPSLKQAELNFNAKRHSNYLCKLLRMTLSLKKNRLSCSLTVELCLPTNNLKKKKKKFSSYSCQGLFINLSQCSSWLFLSFSGRPGSLMIPACPSSVYLTPGSEDVPPPHSMLNTELHWPLHLVG